jgi:hypothetical protein
MTDPGIPQLDFYLPREHYMDHVQVPVVFIAMSKNLTKMCKFSQEKKVRSTTTSRNKNFVRLRKTGDIFPLCLQEKIYKKIKH